MRILVIEDEEALRTQLYEQLSSHGYSVNTAEDGEEGLFYGREYPQDLAVVDIGLPKLSGIEVIQKLRAEGFDYLISLYKRDERPLNACEPRNLLEAIRGLGDYFEREPRLVPVLQQLNKRKATWSFHDIISLSLKQAPIVVSDSHHLLSKTDRKI
jgi:two-component system response regulator PhoP